MTGYSATHTVPATGLAAYASADAGAAPVARLDPWLDVQELRTWGAWAEVACSNGWTCWVDARALVPLAPVPPPPPPPSYAAAPVPAAPVPAVPAYPAPGYGAPAYAAPPSGSPVYAAPSARSGQMRSAGMAIGLAGAVIAVIGAYLPWMRLGDAGGVSASDIPATALLGVDAEGSGPFSIAVVVVVLAAVAAALCFLPPMAALRRLVGVAIVGVVGLFAVQLIRLASQILGTAGAPSPVELLQYLGFGFAVTAVGGLMVLLAPKG